MNIFLWKIKKKLRKILPDCYWDFKWTIKNLIRYFMPIIRQRDFDFYYILEMMKFQLILLRDRIDRGCEINEIRIPKIKDINKVIELISNFENDNFYKRTNDYRKAMQLEVKEFKEIFEIIGNKGQTWWE